MPRYYSARRKSNSKNKKKSNSISLIRPIIFIGTGALCVWLFFVLWFHVSQGPLGEYLAKYLSRLLGQASGLIPLLISWWLIRAILKKSYNFFFFSIGACIVLASSASLLTLLRHVFQDSLLDGGAIGQGVFSSLQKLIGSVGASIFSIALILLGIHMLFAIPWSVVFQKIIEFVKNDFNGWSEARTELKQKIAEGKGEKIIPSSSKKEEASTIPTIIAEEIHELPEIKRPALEIRRPKPEPTISTEKSKETPKQETTIDSEEKSTATESKKFDAATFKLPSLDLLNNPVGNGLCGPTDEEIQAATKKLENTLKSFEIGAHVTGVSPGPVVTRYEIQPDAGVKMSSITALTQDIQASMQARSIRVQAPIPGKSTMGFEIPNDRSVVVTMKEVLQSPVYASSKAILPIALGRHANGDPAGTVAEKWPHILIAGATNSGKSICLHTIIMSLLFKHKPDEVKFLMIDPKRVELTLYEGIPYLYDPKTSCDDADIITKSNDAAKSLQMLVKVMEKRLDLCQLAKVKNIEGYNEWAKKNNEEKMFYVFVVIDEMADLMLQTKASIEDSVQRLAQMGRAMGIHLILCTQRPSVKVVTGIIKANMPSRIALQVASGIDSKVILDSVGAENLLGRGDMLLLDSSTQTPLRIQGAYVSPEEIKAVADFLRAQGGPDYPVQVVQEAPANQRPQDGLGTKPEEQLQALQLIKERRRVSQDLLKAHFGSSARATNILSVLEMKGYITKPEGSNRWEIHYDMIDQAIEELQNPPYDKEYKEETYETVYK